MGSSNWTRLEDIKAEIFYYIVQKNYINKLRAIHKFCIITKEKEL